jgi:uncharacterized PurR-regulated membrane protein YhhQ (DUF165 family)
MEEKKISFWKKSGLFLKDFFNPKEWVKTLRAVPGMALALIVVANILMNVLANKSIIELPIQGTDSYWLIQDAGVCLSWVGFLVGDLLVKNFGAKHAVRVNLTALVISLFISLLLVIVSVIPGTWSPEFNFMGLSFLNEAGETIEVSKTIGQSINQVMGNTWYVILGSALASACGLIVNNVTQDLILKNISKKHGEKYWGYLVAGGISTIAGQILDNFVFAAVVSVKFFGWTWLTAFMCSLDGAIFELIIEMIFNPFAYRISKNWDKNHIGVKWMKTTPASEEVVKEVK